MQKEELSCIFTTIKVLFDQLGGRAFGSSSFLVLKVAKNLEGKRKIKQYY